MPFRWPVQGLELQFFAQGEFRRPEMMDPEILGRLDEMRARAGVPVRVTSDGRTEDDMRPIYGPDRTRWPNSPHLRGTAIDCQPIPNTAEGRMRIVHAALDIWRSGAWPRLGLELADRHVHVDCDPDLTRPYIWPGKSR